MKGTKQMSETNIYGMKKQQWYEKMIMEWNLSMKINAKVWDRCLRYEKNARFEKVVRRYGNWQEGMKKSNEVTAKNV